MVIELSRAVVGETTSPWLDRDERDLAAWLGRRGWVVELVRAKDVERGLVPLDRSTLVVGGISTVRAALRTLGVEVPVPDDYPSVLRDHFHRKIWSSTVGRLRARLEGRDGLPVFAKPKDLKRFTGRVFVSIDDARFVTGLSARAPIWCSEVVVWRSEWRVLVVEGEVIARRHYAGEPWTRPDDAVVRDCVDRLAATGDAPAGYALDVGVLGDGTTAVVERNDGFAFGTYGLETSLFARVLIARWRQLLGRAVPAPGPGS